MKQALFLIHCAIIIAVLIAGVFFVFEHKWDGVVVCVFGSIFNAWCARRALCYDTYYKVKVFTDPENR